MRNLAALVLVLVAAAPAKAKIYTCLDGRQVSLPDDQEVLGRPSLTADGRTVAYVRAAGKPDAFDDPQPSDVVVVNLFTGKSRVIAPATRDPNNPVARVTFALDGRHLYAERTFAGTYSTINEIDVVTGKERQLPPIGIDLTVIRDGPWRGDLLLDVHTCYSTHTGCDYTVRVVTPRGKLLYVLPHTLWAKADDERRTWLARRKWRAW